MVFDRLGDVNAIARGEQGLYRDDTRFLSFLELRVGPERPLLLSSEVARNNEQCTVDLTNTDVLIESHVALSRSSLHVRRSRFLWSGVCYERFVITNYGLVPSDTTFGLRFGADFADIFEVRGTPRARRGHTEARVIADDAVVHEYIGIDQVRRRLRFHCDPAPAALTATSVQYSLHLAPGERRIISIAFACETARVQCVEVLPFDEALAAVRSRTTVLSSGARVETSSVPFNNWLNRSLADVEMLITNMPEGPYPYAGVPWFSTLFGRDGLITAMQLLAIAPAVARGVLKCLAAGQATTLDDARDAQPGKILHETREGEMAPLGEVPFGRYYGSVDSTPLFVMLAGAYYRRTGDLEFIRELWPNLERALAWMQNFGDIDGDGLIEYARRSPTGLVQQGWKDSHDSVRHSDGTLAVGPIALCEVQGYAHAAWRHAANMAAALGHRADAQHHLYAAERLARTFESLFWCEELSTYALALDGHKRPCRVRTSNVGHCLFAGIAREDRAKRAAETLLSPRIVFGLGRAHGGGGGELVQPDVVSQRIGVAARQRDHRRRPVTLRAHRSRADDSQRPARRDRVPRTAAPARIVLRFRSPARRRADAVSGGVLAAGVVVRRGVHAAAGVAWLDRRRHGAHRQPRASPPSRIHLPPPHRQPLGRRRLGGSRSARATRTTSTSRC